MTESPADGPSARAAEHVPASRLTDEPDAEPVAPESVVPEPELDEVDLAVLAMERRNWPGPGAKERSVREELGISPTRYYQLLNALLDDPAALAHDPVTVNRLRRRRQALRARR